MKKIVMFLVCLYLPIAIAKAAEPEHQHNEKGEYRILKEVNFKENGYAFLMVREGGHLLGQPYQVELRVHCGSVIGNPMDVPVKDSFSVCDLQPESVKVNSQNSAIAMKTKMADVGHYDEEIGRGVASPEMRCLQKTKVQKFSLKNLCH